MNALDRWLNRLQLSPRSQRVLTEAALDWQHEVTSTATFVAALLRHCRAACGMLRALAFVIVGETSSALSLSWSTRLVSWVAVMTVAGMWGHAPLLDLPHGAARYELLLMQTICGSLMMASTLAIVTGPSSAKSPLVGYVLVSSVAALVISWVLVPMVWQNYVNVAIGRPLDPARYGPRYPAVFLMMQAAFTVVFCAIADRLRSGPKRLLSAGAVITIVMTGFIAFRLLVAGLLTLLAAGPNAYEQRQAIAESLVGTTSWLLPMWPAAIWFLLVRHQERTALTNPTERPVRA